MDISSFTFGVHVQVGKVVHVFPHLNKHAMQYLNEHFLVLQTGHGSAQNWPPGLLRLTAKILCMWLHEKHDV